MTGTNDERADNPHPTLSFAFRPRALVCFYRSDCNARFGCDVIHESFRLVTRLRRTRANTVPPKTSATITHTAIAGMADTLLDFSKRIKSFIAEEMLSECQIHRSYDNPKTRNPSFYTNNCVPSSQSKRVLAAMTVGVKTTYLCAMDVTGLFFLVTRQLE